MIPSSQDKTVGNFDTQDIITSLSEDKLNETTAISSQKPLEEPMSEKKMGLLEQIIKTCSSIANKNVTQGISGYFLTFDSAKYTVNNADYKVSNAVTRRWYNAFVNAAVGICTKTFKDEDLSLKQQARLAFEIRHYARLVARTHMDDQAALKDLKKRDLAQYGNEDGPTFEWLLKKQDALQRPENEKYQAIIRSSTATNFWYNAADNLGILTARDLVKSIDPYFAKAAAVAIAAVAMQAYIETTNNQTPLTMQ